MTYCNRFFTHFSENLIYSTLVKMSSTSSKHSLFSVEPFTWSNNSLFSTEEYNHGPLQMAKREDSNSDIGKSHTSFFSIEPFNSGCIQKSEDVANSERVDSSSNELASINRSIFEEFHGKWALKDIIFCVQIIKSHLIQVSHVVGIYAWRNLERQTCGVCDRNICPLMAKNKILAWFHICNLFRTILHVQVQCKLNIT